MLKRVSRGAPGIFLSVLFLLFCAAPVRAQSGAVPEELGATVSFLEGEAAYVDRVNAECSELTKGFVIPDGQGIFTGKYSAAEVVFPGGARVRVGEVSRVYFGIAGKNIDIGSGIVLVDSGKGAGLSVNIAKFSVSLNNATVIVESSKGVLKVLVLRGEAKVFARTRYAERVVLAKGQMLAVGTGASVIPRPMGIKIHKLAETSRLLGMIPGAEKGVYSVIPDPARGGKVCPVGEHGSLK
jgi:hypothetical protein